MSVKNVFITLIIVALCVLIGVYVLNTLAPGVVNEVRDTIETQIQKATGISVDFGGKMNGAGTGN